MSHWKVRKSTDLFRASSFKLRSDECELPDARVMPRYYVMEFADWVNVVPVTPNHELVLIRQYRHAGGEMFLEIPGGSTHGGCEGPLEAAQRELSEETGYQSQQWLDCGFHYPNPALQSNRMHTFLALNCQKVKEPQLDPFEDLTVELVPAKDLPQLLESGAFKHSLMSASLILALRQLREKGLIG